RHPHIAQIYQFWLKDSADRSLDASQLLQISHGSAVSGELIIAMDLGDKTLNDRFKECQAQGKEGVAGQELLGYMERAAEALDYLTNRESPIYHCDIKPHNILLVGGSIKICDFGMVKTAADQTSTAGCTPAFAPPELFRAKPHVTSDQYSLALTYYFLRCGRFAADTETPNQYEVVLAHMEGRLRFANVTPAEERVLRKA